MFPQFGEDNGTTPGFGGQDQPEDKKDHQQAVQHPVAPDPCSVAIPCQPVQVSKDPCPHVGKVVIFGVIDGPGVGLFGFYRTLEDITEVTGEWPDRDVF